eukprot:2925177-Karenia_brevis.AAC.1
MAHVQLLRDACATLPSQDAATIQESLTRIVAIATRAGVTPLGSPQTTPAPSVVEDPYMSGMRENSVSASRSIRNITMVRTQGKRVA